MTEYVIMLLLLVLIFLTGRKLGQVEFLLEQIRPVVKNVNELDSRLTVLTARVSLSESVQKKVIAESSTRLDGKIVTVPTRRTLPVIPPSPPSSSSRLDSHKPPPSQFPEDEPPTPVMSESDILSLHEEKKDP